jgi:hypothetical protein
VGDAEVIVLTSSEHTATEGEAVEIQVRLREVHIFDHGEQDDTSVRVGAAAPRERSAAEPHARPSEQAGRRA